MEDGNGLTSVLLHRK